MSRQVRDFVYRLFIIVHIPPTIVLALPLILPQSILPSWARKGVEYYLSTHNDPLLAGKSYPGGWFGGLSVCEVLLHLPFFLWALRLPIGQCQFVRADALGDRRLELPSLVYSVHAWTCVLAAMCELFSFPPSVLNTSDKFKMGMMYIPFQVVLGAMAIDMYKRVRIRLSAIKQE